LQYRDRDLTSKKFSIADLKMEGAVWCGIWWPRIAECFLLNSQAREQRQQAKISE
jgi:hypothetical protein